MTTMSLVRTGCCGAAAIFTALCASSCASTEAVSAQASPDAARAATDGTVTDGADPGCLGCVSQGQPTVVWGLKATASTPTQITVSWSEPSAQEVGTEATLLDGAGVQTLMRAELDAGRRSWEFSPVSAGTHYRIQVREFAADALCADAGCERTRRYGASVQTSVDTPIDEDEDGIDDRAELALANELRPELLMDWQHSDVDMFVPSGGDFIPVRVTDRSGGKAGAEPLCAAGHRCVEIFYGLAYKQDCGAFPLDACMGATWHLGDSEYVVLLAIADDADSSALEHPDRWRVAYAWYSAHNGAVSDSATVLKFEPAARWPIVWVSQGKHANYPSKSLCDQGALGFDRCAANFNLRSALADKLVNVGELAHPIPALIYNPGSGALDYDVWSTAPYGSSDSPGYAAVLRCVVDWSRTIQAASENWAAVARATEDNAYPSEASVVLVGTDGAVHAPDCVTP
jgi:hypothetical protein